jgi:murein DD-endopeptidase MepM/ murein hydrolase activator NlpD
LTQARRGGSPRLPAAAALLVVAWATGCGGAHRPVERVPARPAGVDATPDVRETQPRPAEVATVESPDPTRPAGVYHTVERGQTLWRIARSYGVGVDELAAANGIDDPDRLEAGVRLLVPGATAPLEVLPASTLSVAAADWLWPVHGGAVLSYFGAPRRSHRHSGIDIAGKSGDHVLAARDGVVVYSGASMRGYGKTVILDHGGGVRSLYAHNSKLLVNNGERVQRGQTIARVGRSGNASTEHCHFEIREHDVAQDPMRYVRPMRGATP